MAQSETGRAPSLQEIRRVAPPTGAFGRVNKRDRSLLQHLTSVESASSLNGADPAAHKSTELSCLFAQMPRKPGIPTRSLRGHSTTFSLDLLPPESLTRPLWRSLVGGMRDSLAPEKLPPLQLTSRPVDVGMALGDRLRMPWFRTVFTNIGDVLSPETLPPLELESRPVDVGEHQIPNSRQIRLLLSRHYDGFQKIFSALRECSE